MDGGALQYRKIIISGRREYMAGIGVKLTNIYKKNTLTTDIIGVGYSTVVTIAPMLVVIGALVLMEYFLDFSSVAYITRELFSCTVLYIFIFS